jgi:hypothetical protein
MYIWAFPLVPLGIVVVVSLIQQTINLIILLFFSYIKISPSGIEQKNGYYKHIRCNWSDVDRLGKYLLFREKIFVMHLLQTGWIKKQKDCP